MKMLHALEKLLLLSNERMARRGAGLDVGTLGNRIIGWMGREVVEIVRPELN